WWECSQLSENVESRTGQRIANWMLDHRAITFFFIVVPTIVLAYALPKIEVYSRFADLLPAKHEYIKNYNRMKQTFGGANVVAMSLEVVDPNEDLFTLDTLNKVKMLTEEVDKIGGVNHYQVASIAHPKIRRIRTTAGGLIKSESVLPETLPTDAEGLKKLREESFNNDIVYGKYISADGTSALILAGFDEERLDYHDIFTRLQDLRAEVEADGKTKLYVAGEPMLKGWIYFYANELKVIFAVTLLIVSILLFVHFGSLAGVIIPLIGTGTAAIWGLGLVGWLGYNLDPLILVVPILISARTASHCVQMMERYHDELRKGATRDAAVRTSMGELFVPASIAIFTDAAGLLVLAVSSIPIIAKLGIFCSFWSLSNMVTVAILVPLILSVLPAPKIDVTDDAHDHKHLPSRIMAAWASFLVSPKASVPVFGFAALIIAVSVFYAKDATIGEDKPGSPILFQDSQYNIAAARIAEKFAGANQLSIYFEAQEAHKMKEPEVVDVMQQFGRHMADVVNYGGTRDIPDLVRSINRLYHYDDPRWSLVPTTQRDIGNTLFMYEAGAAIPGVITEYMDLEGRVANFVIFFKDATGVTVHAAIEAAEEFLAAHPLEGVTPQFAGGIIGTTAAGNQEVEQSEMIQTILIMVVVMLSVMVTYRSVTAAFLVFVVLAMAVLINRAYMGFRGIGLNINTLPVTAVGIGIGVDYAIYMLDRIREEVRFRSIDEAVHEALATTGAAVLFTAVTVVAGIAYWIYGSSLRFNSEMSMLLSLLMISNMVGSVTLLPLLVKVFKPSFVMKSHLEQAASQASGGNSVGKDSALAQQSASS
ncbi:MAG: MMPL family transporter, partial [Proteobacteria bacterium]|nr:MMPL family transporter [Pseudomonadota bacterium]